MTCLSRGAQGVTDERGAIMVCCVFFAIVLVGMMYTLTGIGDTLHLRERAQDAADASALSAAVLHARGMNLIVFVNLIMLALVMLLIAVRVVQGLAVLGTTVAAGMAVISGGAAAPLVPVFAKQAKVADDTFRALNRVVTPMLKGLHQTERVVRATTPVASEADVLAEVVRHYRPEARVGFAIPGRWTLPVETDQFKELCSRAGEEVADVLMTPFDWIGMSSITAPLESASGSMTNKFSKWFCGNKGGKAPKHESTVTRHYPRNGAMDRCEEGANGGAPDEAACREAEQLARASSYSESTGECTASRCGAGSPFEENAEQARRQCDPLRTAMGQWVWQERILDAWVVWDARRRLWRIQSEHSVRSTLKKANHAPCGLHAQAVGAGWASRVRSPGQEGTTPLCTNLLDAVQTASGIRGWPEPPTGDGATLFVDLKEVAQLLSCSRQETVKVEMGGEQLGRGGNKMAPHKMADGVDLGGEDFQIRTVVLRQGVDGKTERGLRALAAQEVDSGIPLESLTRLYVAQAEYYHAHNGSRARAECMWNMSWTARLRRFSLPAPAKRIEGSADKKNLSNRTPPATEQEACTEAGGSDCQNIEGDLDLMSQLVVH